MLKILCPFCNNVMTISSERKNGVLFVTCNVCGHIGYDSEVGVNGRY